MPTPVTFEFQGCGLSDANATWVMQLFHTLEEMENLFIIYIANREGLQAKLHTLLEQPEGKPSPTFRTNDTIKILFLFDWFYENFDKPNFTWNNFNRSDFTNFKRALSKRTLQAKWKAEASFGFLPFPAKLSEMSLESLGVVTQSPICARSESKTLFVCSKQGGEHTVIKVHHDLDRANRELLAIEQLSSIPSVINAGEDIVNVEIEKTSGTTTDGYALILAPYCKALVPSLASKALFASYATTLQQAFHKGLCNNDISPDNLLVHEELDGSITGIVTDWEIATAPGVEISPTSGKILFCPHIDGGNHYQYRVASLLGDLESLFYVAVACALDGAPWARAFKKIAEPDVLLADMMSKRPRVTGLYATQVNPFPDEWNDYLSGVRDALIEALLGSGDALQVVQAFLRV